MALRDMQSVLGISTVVSASTIIDTVDSEAWTIALTVKSGTTVTFEDGDDPTLSDAAAVTSQFLIGDTTFTAAGEALIGYVGKKRYIRVTVADPVAATSVYAINGQRRRDGLFTDVNKSS